MSLEGLEIIGSSGCPYVQRVLTLLIETQTPFKYQNIDLANKPPWFTDISPLGKVPALLLPNGKALFESLVINEFIESLLPESKRVAPLDLVVRAENKAWIEFLGTIFTEGYMALTKPSKAEFDAVLPSISHKYSVIEKQIKGPYWNGEKISLIDIAAAPLVQRFSVFDSIIGTDIGDKVKYPKVTAWIKQLMWHPSVNLAASLQVNNPAQSYHNIKSLISLSVDPAKNLQYFEEQFRRNFATRFPTSYLNALLSAKL